MRAIFIDGAILELETTHALRRKVQVSVSSHCTLTLDNILPKAHGGTPKVQHSTIV